MSEIKLGQLIDATAKRDAIHIAICPVVAKSTLNPGQEVGLVDDGTFENVDGSPRGSTKAIGIVDPFLRHAVLAEQRFWLFLFPNTVTSLRHEWTHPAFGGAVKVIDKDREFSEQWLRVRAAEMNCYDDKETAYANLIKGLKNGKLFAHGSDLHGLHDLDDQDELREHAERVLGIHIDWNNFSFSCSC